MNNVVTLDDLILRAKEATGPDPELDALIVAHLNDALLKPYPPSDNFGPHDRWQFWSLDGKHFLGSEHKFKIAPVTASRDEAMNFFKSQFPKTEEFRYGITMWENTENYFAARIWYKQVDPDAEDGFAHGSLNQWEVLGKTLPLAIVIATLEAKDKL